MADGRALLRARQFFEPRQRSADGWNEASTYARDWEASYRRRWQHEIRLESEESAEHLDHGRSDPK